MLLQGPPSLSEAARRWGTSGRQDAGAGGRGVGAWLRRGRPEVAGPSKVRAATLAESPRAAAAAVAAVAAGERARSLSAPLTSRFCENRSQLPLLSVVFWCS